MTKKNHPFFELLKKENLPEPLKSQEVSKVLGSFISRAELLLGWSNNSEDVLDGTIITDGTVSYVKQEGATTITDLPGLVPYGKPMPDHWLYNETPGTTDFTTAFQSFINYLNTSPTTLVGEVSGDYYSSSDLTNLHSVQIHGDGRLKVIDGDWWRFNSNEKNSGFGGLGYNTLYADPNGSSDGSGLASSVPVTATKAVDILGDLPDTLQGLYRIIFNEGVYTTGLNFFDIGSNRGKPLYLQGPSVDAWSKASTPIEPQSITSITSANPPVLTANGHGYSNGDKVFIGFAEDGSGSYDGDGAIYTVANSTTNTFELSGIDGSSWGTYSSSGILFSVNGSSPKAIFYGSGDSSGNGLTFDGNGVVFVNDILGIGWGSRSGGLDEAFIRVSTTKQVRLTNVHAMYCSQGVTIRDESNGLWFSGWGYECRNAFYTIHARFTVGTSNPSSIPDDTTTIQKSTFGVYVWEMSSGHADGLDLIDNDTDVCVRKNSHCVAIYNDIVNNGASKNSLIVEDGSYLFDENNSFTGSFSTRVLKRSNSSRGQQGVQYSWVTTHKGGLAVPTPGGGESTLVTLPVPQGEMSASPQSIRVKLYCSGTWSNDSVVIRLKLGSTTLYTHTLGLNASARETTTTYELEQNGFNSVRIFREEQELISSTTTRLDHSSSAFDTSSGDQDFTVTIEVNSASDSLVYNNVTVETLGW